MYKITNYGQVEDLEIENFFLADFAKNDYIPERKSPESLVDEYIIVGGKDMRLVDALNGNLLTEKEFEEILIERGIKLGKSILKEVLIKLIP